MEQNILTQYEQNPMHDTIMLQWYALLHQTGDAANLLPWSVGTVSQFYEYINPKRLWIQFKIDNAGVWFVAVYTSMFIGAQFDMWVRADKRAGKAWLASMCEALEWGFERWPVLIGLTAQPNLLDGHKRLGYSVVGKVPQFWDGERDLWIMHITKASYEARETMLRKVSNG